MPTASERGEVHDVVPAAGIHGPPSTRASMARIAMLSNALPRTVSVDDAELWLDGTSIVIVGGTVSLAGGVWKNSVIAVAPRACEVSGWRRQHDSTVARGGKWSQAPDAVNGRC